MTKSVAHSFLGSFGLVGFFSFLSFKPSCAAACLLHPRRASVHPMPAPARTPCPSGDGGRFQEAEGGFLLSHLGFSLAALQARERGGENVKRCSAGGFGVEGREAGEPAGSRTEGAQGMPGEGLQPCIPPSLFFPILLVLKVSAAFSGGLPAPCSSVAGSGAWLMACTALKKAVLPSCWA